VFPTSVVRKLSRSEEMFADTQNFVGLTAHLRGPVDVDAMSDAFDALLRAHPLLTARLERGSDGRHQFVVDGLDPPGISVVDGEEGLSDAKADMQLDQTVSLVNLQLSLMPPAAKLCLYVHHSLADVQHQYVLVQELFSFYTEVVCTGSTGPVSPQPAPEPLEVVLEARGIRKQRRSGLERFVPAMFAYDLPPSARGTAGDVLSVPVPVPVARCSMTKQETQDLMASCRDNRVSFSALVAAAILLAEWQIRDTPSIPIPYVYPVDLRYLLAPPVDATGSTNPLGVATYLADIGPDTDILELARDITRTFRADLADGVIQQSLLHFSPQYVGNPPGLPDVVMCTNAGAAPTIHMPPGLELEMCHSELYLATRGGADSYLVAVFAERLLIEHYSHAPKPEESIGVMESQLRSVPSRYRWMTE
jgi:hypothetical protein